MPASIRLRSLPGRVLLAASETPGSCMAPFVSAPTPRTPRCWIKLPNPNYFLP